ncbi:hypothetical protein L1049_014835 [Liquidambar formosana]|uniref:Uncharacterized protein n=1 Tax=Liquidambar formosana TaxID=63359 RepID=A0AAP0RXV8_LIQFO
MFFLMKAWVALCHHFMPSNFSIFFLFNFYGWVHGLFTSLQIGGKGDIFVIWELFGVEMVTFKIQSQIKHFALSLATVKTEEKERDCGALCLGFLFLRAKFK